MDSQGDPRNGADDYSAPHRFQGTQGAKHRRCSTGGTVADLLQRFTGVHFQSRKEVINIDDDEDTKRAKLPLTISLKPPDFGRGGFLHTLHNPFLFRPGVVFMIHGASNPSKGT